MTDKYGGWINKPTQIIADFFKLHDDFWIGTARACWEADDEYYSKPSASSVDKLQRYFRQHCLAKMPNGLVPIAQLLINASFEMVNFQQIAESYLEVIGEEVDDRLTKEAMEKYYPEWKYEQERKEQEANGMP